MDVASTFDVQGSNQGERLVSKALVVSVAEGLEWSDHGRFTRVDAHRVDVFHRTDDGGVIGFVSHHFVFKFLPPQNGLFNQDLRNSRITKAELRDFNEFAHVSSRSTAQTAQSERRSNQDGPAANEFCSSDDLVDGVAGHRLADGEVDGFADLIEQFTVFCFVDGVQV